MDEAETFDIDALGLKCPQPVLLLRTALREQVTCRLFRLRADDPMAGVDIAAFCARFGHELLDQRQSGAVRLFEIRRKA